MVVRRLPFVIRIKDRVGGTTQPIALKIDPGSKTTGLAVVRLVSGVTVRCLWLAELEHRGLVIRRSLEQRRALRHGRRSRNLRYRAPRFDNRRRPAGWLAPSLRHRVDAVIHWLVRLRAWCPITCVAQELVKFDMQLLANPEISGVGYQQGTLAGFEVREWVLEKWGRACVYCGAEGVPLQMDHVVPKARLGQSRPRDLVPACGPCNQHKGKRPVAEFLAKKPEVLKKILVELDRPMRDAAAVNATRWALYAQLKVFGLPVTTGTGGRTKWNRTRLGVPKGHALDALCVGEVQAVGDWRSTPVLSVRCTGRGSHRRTNVTTCGFPRGHKMRTRRVFGFATGDMVRATVPSGKRAGVYIGRVAVRARGSFNIQVRSGAVQGISHKHCRLLMRADGYAYNYGAPGTRSRVPC